MLFAGTLAAQTPVPEWQAGVDKVKSLIKANPEQASDAAGELLKGKNKKSVELQYMILGESDTAQNEKKS